MNASDYIKLVEGNYRYGYALYRIGIHFFDPKLLEHVRYKHFTSKNRDFLTQSTENELILPSVEMFSELETWPADQIISLLEQGHQVFSRYRLPYMNRLVSHIPEREIGKTHKDAIEVLKLSFELFAHDFIRHMKQEENTFFDYIRMLDDVCSGRKALPKCFFRMERESLSDYAAAHLEDDDDMRVIRELTDNYRICPDMPLTMRVLYSELQQFEQDLKMHAAIENQLLFPKAMTMERIIKQKFVKVRTLN